MADKEFLSATRIALFGGPRMWIDNVEVPRIPPGYASAILALLALKPDHRYDRDDLAEALWPDEPADSTRPRLREHLYQLRKAIPGGRDLIGSDRDSIWLATDTPIEVDALSFDRLLKLARETSDESRRMALLADAVALHRGAFAPALDSNRFDSFRRHYAALYFDALRALAAILVELDTERAIGYATRAVDEEPLSEEAAADLIRLHAGSGKLDEARRVFREFERRLKRELGAEPGRELNAFVRGLPSSTEEEPIPHMAREVRIGPFTIPAVAHSPKNRLAFAVAFATLCLALLLGFRPWQHTKAESPPLTPDQRIAILVGLRTAHISPESRERMRAEQCIALAEEAYKAWYGRDEERWIDRLKTIDGDLQASLKWYRWHEPGRAVQLAGALTRYWLLTRVLSQNERWLTAADDRRIGVYARIRARALTGLSLAYLAYPAVRAKQGIRLGRRAARLCQSSGDVFGEAQAIRHVGLHLNSLGRKQEARTQFLRAIALYELAGSNSGLALTYYCQTFITPAELPGHLTAAQYYSCILRCAQLSRSIDNSWMRSAAESCLCDAATVVPDTSESRVGLALVEAEILRWIESAAQRNDLVNLRALWRACASVALRLRNRHIMAESLFSLCATAPNEMSYRGYSARLLGAYLQYWRLDPHARERNIVRLWGDAKSRSVIPEERSAWNRGFAVGQRTRLEHAVRYAVSR